jgi:hypothetical protein
VPKGVGGTAPSKRSEPDSTGACSSRRGSLLVRWIAELVAGALRTRGLAKGAAWRCACWLRVSSCCLIGGRMPLDAYPDACVTRSYSRRIDSGEYTQGAPLLFSLHAGLQDVVGAVRDVSVFRGSRRLLDTHNAAAHYSVIDARVSKKSNSQV